jgi:hypothetical protein
MRARYNAAGDEAAPTAAGKEVPAGMSVGEAPVKQAVKWIDEQLRENPKANRATLVDEASRRFDLSPLDAEFLYRHLASRPSAP